MRISALNSAVIGALMLAALPAAPAPQWIVHKEPGFSVETPPGWTVAADRQKGWVHLMGTQGEDVVIWPVFLPGGPPDLDLRTARMIHQGLAAASPYHVEWQTPQSPGPNIVRARGSMGEMAAVSFFSWKTTPRGVAGYFCSAGARQAGFSGKAAVLAAVLDSFRLTGAAERSNTSGGIQWVQFADPLEGAFTAEVPAGWQVSGGLVRSSPDDPHPVIALTSPDGQTKISLGDPQMSTFFMDPQGAFMPEGSMNGAMMILRYLTGAAFCQFYVANRAPMVCSDVRIGEIKDNPELIQQALAGDPSLAQRPFAIGSVTFQCREQAQPRAGFCQALTHRLMLPMPGQIGMWRVNGPLTYLTPPDRVADTTATMVHMRDSIRFNPQWGMQEVQNAGVRSRIISGTANQIADMAAAGQRNRDAVDDRIAQMRSDATLGIVRLADPVTGRQTTVDSGSDYYWVAPGGTIVGTRVDTQPGVDFRRLIEQVP